MEKYITRTNVIIAGVVSIIIITTLIILGLRDNTESVIETVQTPDFPQSGDSPAGLEGGGDLPTFFSGGGSNVLLSDSLPKTREDALSTQVGMHLLLQSTVIASLGIFNQNTGDPNNEVVRYHKNIPENLGHLFERNADGSEEERRISNLTIPQIFNVIWSPDGTHAIIFYTLDESVKKLLIDYSDEASPVTNFLPDTVSAATFSPDSNSIAFVNSKEDSHNIFIADSDFGNQKKIYNNKIPYVEINWPTPRKIAIKNKSSYALPGFLYLIETRNARVTKVVEGNGMDAIWNNDGSAVLYSTSDNGGRKITTRIYDLDENKTHDLPISTIAEKCVFSRFERLKFYCGVPEAVPLARYPDDWWQGKLSFTDNVTVIDLEEEIRVVITKTESDITKPRLTKNDGYFLFQDKKTGRLWSIKIKTSSSAPETKSN
jgi:hypothetical protein